MTSNSDAKSAARRSGLAARRALDTAARQEASGRICARVVRSHEFRSCSLLGCYLPTPDEVDATLIIERAWRAQKRVFVPVTDAHGVMNFCEITPHTIVTRNTFGIWEPLSGLMANARDLDVVITPVAAFDDHKHRIGMGGGYYDRCFHFLKNRRKWLRPKLIGVAFSCQQVPAIVPDRWDISMYAVVTEADRNAH